MNRICFRCVGLCLFSFALLTNVVVLFGQGVTRDEKPGNLPSGPVPLQVLAKLDKETLIIQLRVTRYRIKSVINQQTGEELTYYEPISTIEKRQFSPSDFQAYDAKGTKMGITDLAPALKEEVPAVISADGKQVDPLHTRILRESIVVLVIPKLNIATVPVAPGKQPQAIVPSMD